MRITKYPPQKRTILLDNIFYKTTMYLPNTTFIDDGEFIFLVYNKNNQWFSFKEYLPNVFYSHICFGTYNNLKPSINNFWNSCFNTRRGNIAFTPNWWENIDDWDLAYKEILKTTKNEHLFKWLLSYLNKQEQQYALNLCAARMVGENLDLFEFCLNKGAYDFVAIITQSLLKEKNINTFDSTNMCLYIEKSKPFFNKMKKFMSLEDKQIHIDFIKTQKTVFNPKNKLLFCSLLE